MNMVAEILVNAGKERTLDLRALLAELPERVTPRRNVHSFTRHARPAQYSRLSPPLSPTA